MRRPIVDDVEIIEPPLEELNKKRSGFSRACFTGCGVFLLLFIGAIVFFRLFAGPGPQTLAKVPTNFPKDIPAYDPDNIERITYISGRYKNRSVEVAAFFPKIILSPLLIALNKNQAAPATAKEKNSWKDLWQIITTPVGDHRDTIQIEWRNLDTDPAFLINYYRNELTKKNFTIEVESSGDNVEQFSFSRTDGLAGSVYVNTGGKTSTTASAILTVNLPPNNK